MPWKTGLGMQEDRAAAADPQNVWTTIFTIAGGVVLVRGFIGLRTVIQAGGASNMQLRHSIGPTVLCAATVITGNDVNTLYTITGNPLDPITIGVIGAPIREGMQGSQTIDSIQQQGVVMFTGNIQVTMTAAAGTGSTGYTIWYIPVTAGATIVAA